MSSASSYAYSVRAEALRRQRERDAAADALQAAQREHAQLREESTTARETWGDSIDVPRAMSVRVAGDTAAMSAARAELERTTREDSKRLAEQVTGARVALMRSAVADLASDAPPAGPKMAAEVISLRPAQSRLDDVADEEDEATIERLLGRLDAEVKAGAMAGVTDAANRVRVASSDSIRERAIDMLRLEVQKANEAIEGQRAMARSLDKLERRLDGCRGPEAAAARSVLARAREDRRAVSGELEERVEAALAAENARAADGFVADTLERVFREQGYEVGPRPATATADGRLLATHRDWPDYGVAVDLAGDPRRLKLELVRGEPSRVDQAARDVEVEKQFCARQPNLLDALDAEGIALREIRRSRPGERRVEVRPDLFEANTRRVRQSEQAARSR